MATFTFRQVSDAFWHVGMGMRWENTAILHKDTGETRLCSPDSDGPQTPEDEEEAGDWNQRLSVPHRSELGLGRDLVLEFVAARLPRDYEYVQRLFRRRGAYGFYTALLDRRRLLDEWHEFSNAREEQAIRAWCEENGVELVD